MEKQLPSSRLTKLLPPPVEWLLAVTALGLSYGMVSLALDSGSLLEYAVALALVAVAAVRTVRGFRSFQQRRRNG